MAVTVSRLGHAIPAEDLTRQYPQIEDEVMAAVREVLPRGKYTLGPQVVAFEEEFARFCGVSYGVGISNGTEALHLALLACEVGTGDEVITVPNTYAATVFAISYVGATPVYVDVDACTFNLDPAGLEAAITPRTKAILPVHMYGQPVDMDPLLEIARRRGLRVIEDASHAHGATYQGRRAGSLSDIACFSFYPSKNLGAFGDGGAAVTADEDLYRRLRQLRYMGQKVKHEHEIVGYQQRLDELQAAILRVKLRHLPRWNAQRRRWAALYDQLLAATPVTTPFVQEGTEPVYYMYTIRASRRDALKAHLEERGVGTQIIYPKLVPQQGAYQGESYRPGSFPHAEQVTGEILSLPIFPELTEEEVRYVVACIAEFYA
jgi:dTDP-4-amino-4,6-dideoxygalactose transaminase